MTSYAYMERLSASHRPIDDFRRTRISRLLAVASVGILLAGCGVSTLSTRPTAGPTELGMIDQCFDGSAAARVGDVTLEYNTTPAGSMRVLYRTHAAEQGETLLSVSVTAEAAGFSTSQEMTFTIPVLTSRSLRVSGKHRVAADLHVEGGLVTGESMVVGGDVIAVTEPIDGATLLPGAPRVLLPFMRVGACSRASLPSFYPPDTHHTIVIEVGRNGVPVEVPTGQFNAIEVFVDGRHGREVYLVQADFPHFIVRSSSADGMLVSELTAIIRGNEK